MASSSSSSCENNDSSTSNPNQFQLCFNTWLANQQQDLDELLEAATSWAGEGDNNKLRLLVDKNIKHFQDYCQERCILVQCDASSFLCPSWCSSLENSLLWIGGCRPSLAIRLIYALVGTELEARLEDYLKGERDGKMGEISASQLSLINEVHHRTVREEESLGSRMASLQEDVVDEPLASIARELINPSQPDGRAEKALEAHGVAMGRMLVEADELRMKTLKSLLEILTPLQAVDMLISTKKLHLSVHAWGKRQDCARKTPSPPEN